MKFDFNIRPAAEIPATQALQSHSADQAASSPLPAAKVGAPVSELSLLARRQSRLARRATR